MLSKHKQQHRQAPSYQRASQKQLKRPTTPQQSDLYAFDPQFQDMVHKKEVRDRFGRLSDWMERVDSAKFLHRELTRQRIAWENGESRGDSTHGSVGRPATASSVASSMASSGRGGSVRSGSIRGGARPVTVSASRAPPSLPAEDEYEKRRQRGRQSSAFKVAEEALNARFTDMKKAFRFVDTDNSGTLDRNEIRRAMDMWNIPIDDEKLDDLIAACDADGDGNVVYNEFVDVLARDTVAPAALGKRGMQSKEAMGVSAYALLDEMIAGGPKKKAFDPSINA